MKKYLSTIVFMMALMVGILIPVKADAATDLITTIEDENYSGQLNSGEYYLSRDLNVTTPLSMSVIGDVSIDMKGHSITGSIGANLFTVEEYGHLTIENGSIKDITFTYYYGLLDVYYGSCDINNVVFENIVSEQNNQILYVSDNGNLRFNSCTFKKNEHKYNGIIFADSGNIELKKCTVTENKAVNAIVCAQSDSTLTISDSYFEKNMNANDGNNYTDFSGAAICAKDSTLELSRTTFDSNVSYYHGGAICAIQSDTNVTACNFTNNKAVAKETDSDEQSVGSCGGAIFFVGAYESPYYRSVESTQGRSLTIVNGKMEGNEATAGGAIYNCCGGRITISGTELKANKAANGGAIFNSQNDVAGIYNSGCPTTSSYTINRAHFNDNDGLNGGAIFNAGGVIQLRSTDFNRNGNKGDLSAEDAMLKNPDVFPDGSMGGAILNMMRDYNTTTDVNLTNCTIRSCKATLGDAIALFSGDMKINGSIIEGNGSAEHKGVTIFASQFGNYSYDAEGPVVDIFDSKISDNLSYGMTAMNLTKLKLDDTSLQGNAEYDLLGQGAEISGKILIDHYLMAISESDIPKIKVTGGIAGSDIKVAITDTVPYPFGIEDSNRNSIVPGEITTGYPVHVSSENPQLYIHADEEVYKKAGFNNMITTWISETSHDLQIVEHTHTWRYQMSSSKDAILAYCDAAQSEGICGYHGSSNAVKAQLIAPKVNSGNDIIYDGKKHEASVQVDRYFPVKSVNITYSQNPVNAGTYTANITVGGVKASKTFEIKKAKVADNNYVEPQAVSGLVADGKSKVLATAGSAKYGTMFYSLDKKNWSKSLPSAKEAGSYKIYFYVEGDVNHMSIGSKASPIGFINAKIAKKTETTTVVKVPTTPTSQKASFINLKLFSSKQTKNSIALNWSEVSDADGYLIYGSVCKKGLKPKLIKTIGSGDITKWNWKGLKKGKYYKSYVVAYKNVAGKKKTIVKSIVIHITTKGGKNGVAKALKVKKIGNKTVKSQANISYSLKKGTSAIIKAVEVKDKLRISHHEKIKYESTNAKVVKVSAGGKMTAVSSGKAIVYVYAQNGVYKAIRVTVK